MTDGASKERRLTAAEAEAVFRLASERDRQAEGSLTEREVREIARQAELDPGAIDEALARVPVAPESEHRTVALAYLLRPMTSVRPLTPSPARGRSPGDPSDRRHKGEIALLLAQDDWTVGGATVTIDRETDSLHLSRDLRLRGAVGLAASSLGVGVLTGIVLAAINAPGGDIVPAITIAAAVGTAGWAVHWRRFVRSRTASLERLGRRVASALGL